MYDVHDLERQNGHMVGELKDAKRILKEYLENHDKIESRRECLCHACIQARAWLARNK